MMENMKERMLIIDHEMRAEKFLELISEENENFEDWLTLAKQPHAGLALADAIRAAGHGLEHATTDLIIEAFKDAGRYTEYVREESDKLRRRLDAHIQYEGYLQSCIKSGEQPDDFQKFSDKALQAQE